MNQLLSKWYNENKRDLPWRNTHNPYTIWLSEIILQQTRVEQGLPYFYNFFNKYESIIDFANAPINDILKIWQGLGYYSRARNMHKTAQIIRDELNGNFPENYEDLIKLKGIGPYTAAAIASFAFNKPNAVVDGNVYRVIARFAGIYTDTNSTEGKKEFAIIAQQLLDLKNPAIHNQAMMELGALVCKPQNPDCVNCPIQINCFAFLNMAQSKLPVKIKKLKTKVRYFNYFIFQFNGKTYIKQRGPKDIWEGLFEFILHENSLFNNEKEVIETIIEHKYFENLAQFEIQFLENCKHILTHQTLHASFWKINCNSKPKLPEGYIEIEIDEIKNYAVPRLLDKLISNSKLPHQLFI